jgi:hypothetical protein
MALLGMLLLWPHLVVPFVRMYERDHRQRQRNKRAMGMRTCVLNGEETRRFALYLRPFEDRRGVRNFPDPEWQSDALMLMEAAELIMFVPAVSAGCLWELQSVIHNDVLGKCVFFLPPPFLNGYVVQDEITRQMLKDAPDSLAELDPEVAWAEFASAAANCGLIVPEYDKRGLMFRFTEHGTQFVPHQYLRGIVRKCAIGWAAMALIRGDIDHIVDVEESLYSW